ncbi:hypothetical protein [Verminephrobacter aporrectodeae]|uniref:hypothetical protein n=1 Tax=Verminephrobacter aporrectodeae TaxID=1110389 RepID=UPI00389AB567
MLSTTTKPGSSGHTDTLFENLMFSPDSTTAPKPRALKSIPRVQSPVCNQVELRAYDLDFRRRETLKDLLEQAQTQVQALRKELDDNPGAGTRRVRAARQPAAAEREQRVTRALRTVEVIDKRLSGKAAKHSPESIQADGTADRTCSGKRERSGCRCAKRRVSIRTSKGASVGTSSVGPVQSKLPA